jgi:hypothetical protein
MLLSWKYECKSLLSLKLLAALIWLGPRKLLNYTRIERDGQYQTISGVNPKCRSYVETRSQV